jgi:A118 family predicted phage portal protein
MGFINFVKGVFNKMFNRQEITRPFGISTDMSAEMTSALQVWDKLYRTSPTCIASVIASEAARLATIDMNVTVTGSEKADYIQSILDENHDKFRSKLELGCAYGGLVLKPNEEGIDFVPAPRYIPISFDGNGNITAIIFMDIYKTKTEVYTRLEYHHFDEEGNYNIQNKAFRSSSDVSLGSEVSLSSVEKWKNIEKNVTISGVARPLFGYFRMPTANNVDIDSPLGVSIFSKAVDTCEDFDMWYSKWKREGKLSDKILFVDEQAMMHPGQTGRDKAVPINPLPELIKGLRFGNNANKCVEEWSPTIRVDEYRQALQTQLDLIAVQCGFSSGYFSFDSRTGAVTATQVESEDQRTFSTCTDIQQNYAKALKDLVYALDVMSSLYDRTPEGKYDISIYTKDLFVNTSEDRDRAYQLSQNGYIPKWKYLVDYEGYSEEEAKSLVAEAESLQNKE